LPNTYATSNLVSWQDQAQRLVSDLDRSKPCGWIVDLRRNPGGNMWPMLVAIGPVLGEGDVGSFITADSARTGWFYAAGEAGTTSGDVRSVRSKVENAHQLNHPGAPVAVLIGPSTASAGEAIAVAFHGRPLTIFIGEATAGVPTANTLIALGDGAKLNLTVAADADRDGVVFWPGSVRPDLAASATVVDPTNTSDEAAQTAVRWLHRQAACQPDSVSAP
jgi:C-terminal processing protease CtpA/Prc